jgi:myo-inositol catabolism protein IolS
LEMSTIGVGCWTFGCGEYWGDQDQKDDDAVVRRALDLGINYFDTAEAYNEGRSEESLGKAIRDLPRQEMVISSKVSPSNTYPETLITHCHASLKRLGTDYIDLYMIHWPIHPHSIRHFTPDEKIVNNPPDVREAYETMQMLQKQGKIRYIGLSNFGVNRIKEVKGLGIEVVAEQLPYSLLTRAIEWEVLPFCIEQGIGVIGYITLFQGILTDKFSTLDDVPLIRRRTRHFDAGNNKLSRHGEAGAEHETIDALASIRSISRETGIPVQDLAIRWILSKKGLSSALVGSRTVRQLEANVKAASGVLPAEIIAKLDEAARPLKEKMSKSFDYYESTANDRT